MRFNLCTWLDEISSCSCFTFLPGPAWVLLSKICKDFFSALYKSIGVDETPSCSQGEFSGWLPNGRGEFFYGNGEKALDKYVGDFVDGAVSEN